MSTVEQAAALLPTVRNDLERAKRWQRELRDEMVAADAEVTRLRDLERSIEAVVNGTVPEPAGRGVVGWRLGHAAAAVIRQRGPMHYREVWNVLREQGVTVDSDEPAAVVLTQLTRHPDVERVGRGVYGLQEEAAA